MGDQRPTGFGDLDGIEELLALFGKAALVGLLEAHPLLLQSHEGIQLGWTVIEEGGQAPHRTDRDAFHLGVDDRHRGVQRPAGQGQQLACGDLQMPAVVLSEGLVGPGDVSHGTGGHDKAR